MIAGGRLALQRRGSAGSRPPTDLVSEGHAEHFQQGPRLFIGFGRRDDGHIEPLDLLDLIVIDFRKNNVLADTQGVIAVAIEGLRRYAAEIA